VVRASGVLSVLDSIGSHSAVLPVRTELAAFKATVRQALQRVTPQPAPARAFVIDG